MSENKDKRAKIIAKVRALRAKTVENGATEAEAMAAAAVAARLMAEYDLSMTEIDAEEAGFAEQVRPIDDDVTRRLWPLVFEIARLTDTRAWADGSAVLATRYTFFGLPHDVEVAGYLLDICETAMRCESERFAKGLVLLRARVRQVKTLSFLDGMAASMRLTLVGLYEARHQVTTGRSLVPLKGQLIEHELERRGEKFKDARGSYRDFDAKSFLAGKEAGDRVRFDPGISQEEKAGEILDASEE